MTRRPSARPALGTVSLLAIAATAMAVVGPAAADAQSAPTPPPAAAGAPAAGAPAANAAQSDAAEAAVEAAITASRQASAKIVATTAPAAAAPPDPAAAAPLSAALSVLLRQAAYWRDQNNPPRAIEAAQRALRLSPDNAQALGIIAEVQASTGNITEAQQTLALLQQTNPGAPEIHQAQQAVRIGAIDPNALGNARQLAQQGSDAQAVNAYRQIFGGAAAPPDSLAVEYYQTLGGTAGGYQPALGGLADAVRRDPNDMRAQLAYAQALTYRADSRLQGIARLAALSDSPSIGPQARESWRQALGWLPLDQSSVAAIKTYQARYPDDPNAATLLANALHPPHQAPGAQFVSEAYDAFHRNDLAQAEQLFGQALAANQNDASATGGLGLVMLREGRTAEATTLLRRAMALDPKQAAAWQQALAGAAVTNQFAAAQAASNRGDLPGAEQAYRALLARQPGNAGIKMALAGVLAREGNQEEANSLLAQVEASGGGRLSDQARAQLLAQQAQAMPDAAGQIALYRSAIEADPSSPWLHLDLARALVKNGQPADAQGVMAEVTDVSRPSAAAVQAGIVFANETGNSAEAVSLIDQVPPRLRTADMRAALAEAQVQGQINAAEAYAGSDPGAARQQLLAIAAQPDPSGARGLAVAKAFMALSDPADAQTAIATAAGANPSAGGPARLLWAQGLLSAGDTAGANAMIASVPTDALTPDQRTSLEGLRNGIAIRTSDTLNTAGRTADAYDQLAPALMQSPDDPALNSALARLYQTANDPQKALAINERILQNDPNNPDARRGAVAAAIQTGDYALASRFVNDNLMQNPNDPQNWILAADIAQARGLNADALHDLRQARALRQQQLGDTAGGSGPGGSFMVASNGPAPAPLGAVSNNPFRNAPTDDDPPAAAAAAPAPETTPVGILAGTGLVASSTLGSSTLGSTLTGSPGAAAPDPMIADLDNRIQAIQLQIAPYISASTTLQFRSGSAGTGQLATYAVPLEGSFSPGGVGRVTFTATPTYLSAGSVGSPIYDQEDFDSAVLGGPASGTQTATGVGLDLGYAYKWLSLDAGSTPLGFTVTNFVGGVEIAPTIAQDLVLRLTGERRAVTDSLLSYSGSVDPRTGVTYGGVTRTRVHGQLEFSPGVANFYAGGGYDWLDGQNVVSNHELELGAGGSYPVYKTPSDEVRVGLNLIYFGFGTNEDHFTDGYGGYFSPQDYVAAVVPVTWTATRGALSYTLGASVGLQDFTANSGLVFPNDQAMQQALEAEAAANTATTLQTSYPSQNVSGFVGGLNGSFEYHLTPALQVGGSAAYQKSADWNEADVMAFARYTFMNAE